MKSTIAIALLGALFLTSCTSTQKGTETSATTILSSSERIAQGKVIFDNSCGKCHDLPDPKSRTSVQWVGIMNAMAPKAHLTDAQHEMTYEYVASLSKK